MIDLLLAQSPLLKVWDASWPFLIMLLGFSAIVFVHELGHFAVAKWVGIRVEKFAIGFGRELFGFDKGETRYSFNILPLGGYVKMLGQEDFDDKAEEVKFKDDPRSFVNKGVGQRMAVVSAGVIMNILFAFFLFAIVFMIGMEVSGTHVGFVEPDSPADKAGLLPGDDIKEINGTTIREFAEVSMAVVLAPPHEPIDFVVERANGKRERLSIEPERNFERDRFQIGIAEGCTRQIVRVGPDMDPSNPQHPHVGDVLVEVDGQPVTDENINQVRYLLPYVRGDIYVERKDSKNPDAPPERVRITIPPILQLYPSAVGDETAVNVLGLTPLVRFNYVEERGRADLAGIQNGDTVVSWDDTMYPTKGQIDRAIRQNPGRDIEFTVLKPDGRRLKGFVRPKPFKKAAADIHAYVREIDEATENRERPQAYFASVKRNGEAYHAGIEKGDTILRWAGIENPTAAQVNRSIRGSSGEKLAVKVLKEGGRELITTVTPQPPGSVQAQYRLLANDSLRVGQVVDTIGGKPTPAALARIPTGALITAVNGDPVKTWRDLIDRYREYAGTTVELTYRDVKNAQHTVDFPVPHCLHTKIGLGPEARIVRIDGKEAVSTDTGRGTESVSVGHHIGMRAKLQELAGQKNVPVQFRRDLLSETETAHIDVTEDMVDPWLERVKFLPNAEVGNETKILKGENALDAIWIGIRKTHYFVIQVYQTIHRMLFARTVGVENMSGPVGIVALGGKVARSGLTDFLFFMALISANLAVINFLPLPIVDGGLMIFLLIEKIKGSPVSLRIQVITQFLGMFLIISAFIYVTFNDVMKLL
jgi:membrane-associated protease RseP (regulator of RpoE activity)